MLELTAGPTRLLIDLDAGGRLASWRVYDLELLVQRESDNHPFGWGSYAMVPWAGRIRNGEFAFDGVEHHLPATLGPHAIHGTGYDNSWMHLSGGKEWAMIGMRFSEPWPFGGTCTHLLHLTSSSLTQTLTIAAADRDMPASLGWHPWFRRKLERGSTMEIDVDMTEARIYTRDDDHACGGRLDPVPPRPWDDAFVGVGKASMTWPGALHIDVEHDCSHMVIYDPKHSICVEPQSGPNNGFNINPGHERVCAGDVLEHTVTWRWTMASTR